MPPLVQYHHRCMRAVEEYGLALCLKHEMLNLSHVPCIAMHQLDHSVVATHHLSGKGRSQIDPHPVFPLQTCVPAYSGKERHHCAMHPGKSFLVLTPVYNCARIKLTAP